MDLAVVLTTIRVPTVLDHYVDNALAAGTWAPFNSQNTALWRDVIPAYFLSPDVGRYDDIWASYVVKRIADHLGDLIAFGHPLVRQERNLRDIWHDLALEQTGMALTDQFCAWLRAIRLSGTSYRDCYTELWASLTATVAEARLAEDGHRLALQRFCEGMRVWIEAMARAGG